MMFTHQADTTRNTTVAATTEMFLVSGATPLAVTAELFYSAHDAYAVHVGLSVAGSPGVEWVFARDLLRDGLTEATGDGDIRIYPELGNVIIDLRSPHGSARLAASMPELRMFVRQMYKIVPNGSETDWLHIDDTPEALLDAEADLGTNRD